MRISCDNRLLSSGFLAEEFIAFCIVHIYVHVFFIYISYISFFFILVIY